MEKKDKKSDMIMRHNLALSSISQVNSSLTNREMTVYEMIIANNHAISNILRVNGTLYNWLDEDGIDAPRGSDLIRFPGYTFRTMEDCKRAYHLSEIIKNDELVKRVAQCIQVGDFSQYMLDRFNLYGPTREMVYMQWYICKISALEAMVTMTARHLGISREILSQNKKESIRNILENRNYRDIVKLTDERINELHELFDWRNNIHLIPLGKEEKTLEFDQRNIDNAETVLKEIAELLNNAMQEQEKSAQG